MRLEDKNGFPWTASIGIGWIILIVIVFSGAGYVLLSVYLALWIGYKSRSFGSLIGFGISMLAACVANAFNSWHRHDIVVMWLEPLGVLLFVGSTFLLRAEIIRYYRQSEGWNIEIGPFLTLFFGAFYINWCLNPATLTQKDTVTSLNLK